jgi:hypothetical protein
MLEPCLLLPLRLLRKRPVETPKATPTHRARALEPLSPISTYHAPPTVEHTHRSNCSKHAASAGARGTSPTTQIPDAWAPLSRRAWPVSTSAPAGAEHAPMPNCQRAGAAGPGGGRGESESSLARQAPWLAQPLTLRRSRGLVGQRASQRRRWATGDGQRATRDGRWAMGDGHNPARRPRSVPTGAHPARRRRSVPSGAHPSRTSSHCKWRPPTGQGSAEAPSALEQDQQYVTPSSRVRRPIWRALARRGALEKGYQEGQRYPVATLYYLFTTTATGSAFCSWAFFFCNRHFWFLDEWPRSNRDDLGELS